MKKACKCKRPENVGITLYGSSEEKDKNFLYLEEDEWMHIECYVVRCVDESLKKRK